MSAIRSGIVTGLSTVTINASAAIAGLYMSHRFGRTAETDGFLAAYGVYLVLVLGVQSLRMVAGPDLARAAADGRLSNELSAYVTTLVLAGLPATTLALLFSAPLGHALIGGLPPEAAAVAGGALAWLVPAACAQLFAALAASVLAALDDYAVAAAAYGAGAVAGVLLFVALAESHGLRALAWGVALNGLISAGVPFAFLAAKGTWRGRRTERFRVMWRLRRLIQGAALPLALQGFYVITIRLAADLGVGMVTLFSYAYMFSSGLVAVTASSMSLISSAPLTRRALGVDGASAHVVHTSWLSLSVVAGAAAAAATAGDRLALVLGTAFGGDAGRQLGFLILCLAPWTVVTIVLSVALPLLFVMDRARLVVPLAILAVILHAPVSLALRSEAGLPGLELALALSTALVLLGVMARLSARMVVSSARVLGRVAVVEAGLTLAAFGPISLAVGRGVVAALGGLVVYIVLHALVRPRGLAEAWVYVRDLEEPVSESNSR